MLQPEERDAVEDQSGIPSKYLRTFSGFRTDCGNFDEDHWLDWTLAAPADRMRIKSTSHLFVTKMTAELLRNNKAMVPNPRILIYKIVRSRKNLESNAKRQVLSK
jgi:hypothetical protein